MNITRHLARTAVVVALSGTLLALATSSASAGAPRVSFKPDLVVSRVNTVTLSTSGPYTLYVPDPTTIRVGTSVLVCVTFANTGNAPSSATSAYLATRGPRLTTVKYRLDVPAIASRGTGGACSPTFALPDFYAGNQMAAYSATNRWDFSVRVDSGFNEEWSSDNNWGFGTDWTMIY